MANPLVPYSASARLKAESLGTIENLLGLGIDNIINTDGFVAIHCI
jgi:hypothetical protein